MPRERHRWSPVCEPPRNLFHPVPIDPLGLSGPTPNQARGPRWRRASAGLYVAVPADNSGGSTATAEPPEQRALEASTLLGRSGAVTGWAALRLAGAAFFDGRERDGRTLRPVDLVSGPRQARRARTGVRWHQDRLAPEDVYVLQGIRCTRPERALFDVMRQAPSVRDAVVAMDMAAAADLTSVRRMWSYVKKRSRWNGAPVVRRALDLADENSRSPGESRMRLTWVLDARCPKPQANRDVFGREGRLLGVADLVDDETGVVGEYDGGEHGSPRRRSADAERDSAFRDHGLEVFRVTGYDEHHPELVVARTRAAYDRARSSTRPRRWTLQPPPDWPRAVGLDAQLDLQDLIRAQHTEPDP